MLFAGTFVDDRIFIRIRLGSLSVIGLAAALLMRPRTVIGLSLIIPLDSLSDRTFNCSHGGTSVDDMTTFDCNPAGMSRA